MCTSTDTRCACVLQRGHGDLGLQFLILPRPYSPPCPTRGCTRDHEDAIENLQHRPEPRPSRGFFARGHTCHGALCFRLPDLVEIRHLGGKKCQNFFEVSVFVTPSPEGTSDCFIFPEESCLTDVRHAFWLQIRGCYPANTPFPRGSHHVQ